MSRSGTRTSHLGILLAFGEVPVIVLVADHVRDARARARDARTRRSGEMLNETVRRALLALAALGLAMAASPRIGAAAAATMNPVADAFVSSANASSNYGASGGLEASAIGSPKG